MLQAMYNGVSAIQATQEDLDVIGNNIANVNTTAFKASEVTFSDQLSQTLEAASAGNSSVGGTDPMQTGLGVKIGSINSVTAQGGLLSVNSPSALAIQGNGYFLLGSSGGGGVSYTRDGNFAIDSAGTLVDASTGQNVLGWAANQGVISTSTAVTPASTLTIGGGTTTAQATTQVQMSGNLNASATGVPASDPNSTYSQTMQVFDSQGKAHTIDLTFVRQNDGATPPNATNVWDWTATGDPGLTATGNTGSVTFNTSGIETGSTGTVTFNPATGGGATDVQTITPNFTAVTQYAGTSNAAAQSQNGFPTGTLSSYSIDQNGVIQGIFSNGMTQALGQVALASFTNPGGLSSGANNTVAATANSGSPVVAAANTQGLGSISAGYLEQSNVDLSTEFSNMIVAQRSFQANTKIVTTVDEMLSDLMSMKQ